MNGSNLIALALVIPLIGAVGIAAASRIGANARETVTLITAGALAWTVWSLVPELMQGGRPSLVLAEVVPGIELAFSVEPLGMLFAALASSLWIVNSIYSIGYMRGNNESNQTRFYMFLRGCASRGCGYRVCRQPVHAVPVLRNPDAINLPAGLTQGRCENRALGPNLSWHLVNNLDRAAASRHHLDLLCRRHGHVHTGRHSRRQSRRRRRWPVAGTVCIRCRQGSRHAGASLVAGGDGCANPGQRTVARRRGRQGRRLHGHQDHHLHFRRRLPVCRAEQWLAGLRGRLHNYRREHRALCSSKI